MEKNSKKKWTKVGSILSKKDNDKEFYIKTVGAIPADAVVTVRSVKQELDSLVKNNLITAEEAEERQSKIPSFVKYNLYLVE